MADQSILKSAVLPASPMPLFLDALASLETTQVSESVSDSFSKVSKFIESTITQQNIRIIQIVQIMQIMQIMQITQILQIIQIMQIMQILQSVSQSISQLTVTS